MRTGIRLTPANPQQYVSVPWEVSTVQVNNPTGSAVLMRQGGTDFPTQDSADQYIPAQTLVQLPVVGGVFAFIFATPAVLGIGVLQKVCNIRLYSATEKVGQIGSVQPIARPPLADRNPLPITLSYQARFVGPHAPTTRWTYTTPVNRKTQIGSISTKIIRDAAAGAVATAEIYVTFTPFGGATQYMAVSEVLSIAIGSGNAYPSIGGGVMNPGDTLACVSDDSGGSGTCSYLGTLLAVEGDA